MIKTIAEIIKREGGYVDDPADPGGATKFGITLRTLAKWRGHPVDKRDVMYLSEYEAGQIYEARYIDGPGYLGIADPHVLDFVVDSAVNFGPDDATPWLQQACNILGADLKVDGACGPKTVAVANSMNPLRLCVIMMALRIMKRGRRITDAPSQSRFAAGWANRDGSMLIDLMR